MKLQRVIHYLEDGRRKYVTHNGQIEKWSECELANLRRNFERFGQSAYTADFAKYDVTVAELRRRYPEAKIVRVAAFEHEDYDLPLNPDIIF